MVPTSTYTCGALSYRRQSCWRGQSNLKERLGTRKQLSSDKVTYIRFLRPHEGVQVLNVTRLADRIRAFTVANDSVPFDSLNVFVLRGDWHRTRSVRPMYTRDPLKSCPRNTILTNVQIQPHLPMLPVAWIICCFLLGAFVGTISKAAKSPFMVLARRAYSTSISPRTIHHRIAPCVPIFSTYTLVSLNFNDSRLQALRASHFDRAGGRADMAKWRSRCRHESYSRNCTSCVLPCIVQRVFQECFRLAGQ